MASNRTNSSEWTSSTSSGQSQHNQKSASISGSSQRHKQCIAKSEGTSASLSGPSLHSHQGDALLNKSNYDNVDSPKADTYDWQGNSQFSAGKSGTLDKNKGDMYSFPHEQKSKSSDTFSNIKPLHKTAIEQEQLNRDTGSDSTSKIKSGHSMDSNMTTSHASGTSQRNKDNVHMPRGREITKI